MAEENKSARPLPANYVTILDLQQRWLKQQQQRHQQQQEQAEQIENQQVQTQEKQQQPPPPSPIEAIADRNPKPRNRNPNWRRNNNRINAPVEQLPSETNGSVSVEVASPDLNIAEQEAKKTFKQWKKKERRKTKKKETVKSVPEAAEAEIVCGLAETSVNVGEAKSCSDEIRCNSRLVNAVKETKEEIDRCGDNAVKQERRGWSGGRREGARRPDWRNSGSVVRYDRRMGSGGSGLVWVKKTEQAS